MKIIATLYLVITIFSGCAFDAVEPKIIEDEIDQKCPRDAPWQHKKYPERCIFCDSLNMNWHKTYIDTLKCGR